MESARLGSSLCNDLFTEQMLQSKSEQGMEWERRMEEGEMLDSGFFMEEEEEPVFDSESDLHSDGLLSSDGCQERVESDWVLSMRELLFMDDEERLENDESCNTVNNVEGEDQDERSKEEKMESVYLGPGEGCGHTVRISIEEMETYCRLCRRCCWICGRCQHRFGSSLLVFFCHHISKRHFHHV